MDTLCQVYNLAYECLMQEWDKNPSLPQCGLMTFSSLRLILEGNDWPNDEVQKVLHGLRSEGKYRLQGTQGFIDLCFDDGVIIFVRKDWSDDTQEKD